MSRSLKVRGEYRAKWDMVHEPDNEYSRSRNKREMEEVVSEGTGSLSENEDEDLKPFWEDFTQEDELLDQEKEK